MKSVLKVLRTEVSVIFCTFFVENLSDWLGERCSALHRLIKLHVKFVIGDLFSVLNDRFKYLVIVDYEAME